MAARSLDRQVLEHQTSAIVVVSSALCIKLVNPAAEDLFGVSGQRVLGTALETLFQQPDQVLGNSAGSSTPGQSFTLRQQHLCLPSGRN